MLPDLLEWARTCERSLPWKGERDPYRVLVSEVMLQQTQASRVAAVYPSFLERFGDVAALADAEAAEVLRSWGGLGYPRRALNLWRACRIICDEGFPEDVEGLERLPGVGPYTARAVACFAFGADVGVVEANVRRILTRYFEPDGAKRLHRPDGAKGLQALADELVPPGDAARWNQALMDLGAEVCRPRAPRCEECPLRSGCAWTDGVRTEDVRRDTVAFEDTRRYARGRVMQALRVRSPLSVAAIVDETGLSSDRVEEAVQTLREDDLVHLERGTPALGPAPL